MTLSRVHGGNIEGYYFYLSNDSVGKYYPLITIRFENYEAVLAWYLKYNKR
jgi:hypothetical protein